MMSESKCEQEQVKGRIIFMSMYNDIVWVRTRKQRESYCEFCQKCKVCSKIPALFLGPGSEKKWCGTHTHSDGEWDKTAKDMMLNFAESGYPVFRAIRALERGEMRSKGKGKNSFHLNGSDQTVELILRTYFCQSAQYLRSSCRLVHRISQRLTKCRKTSRK